MAVNAHSTRFSLATLCCFLLLLALLPSIGLAQISDDGFNPSPNNSVQKLAVQADGKVIVGGDFTVIRANTRMRLARLNVDGTLDGFFAATPVDDTVRAIVVQANGQIVIGGNFNQVGGSVRNHLARLNADGTLDMSFNPIVNNTVSTLALQAD
ncbi:MAG: delta-60 repeat domain-containing protein, partial [Dokdonella sp.]